MILEGYPGLRATVMVTYFIIASISTYVGIIVGYPLWLVNRAVARAWTDLGKRYFGVMLIAMTQALTRSSISLYAEPELAATFRVDDNGYLHTQLDPRAVVISNHQLYNDWVYMWWLAYTSNLHGSIAITLKESLRRVPIYGWGMQHFGFLFLSRSWAKDEAEIAKSMRFIKSDPSWPTWLLLFPEGTTMSANGVRRSNEFSAKSGLPSPKNLLLPRSRGMRAVLENLDNSIETVYDLTMYYDGIPEGRYGEDYYSLKNMYLNGTSPKNIRIHIRKHHVKDIPFRDDEEFTFWLKGIWEEKDEIFEKLKADKVDPALGTPVQVFPKVESFTELYAPLNIPMALTLGTRLLYKHFFA